MTTITDFVAGDDLTISRIVNAIPAGITIAEAWFTVKRSFADTDLQAIIQKHITTVSQTNIGVIDDNAAGDTIGHLYFYLTAAETALLTPLSEYQYDIQIKTSDGKLNTPEPNGTIIALPQVTRAT